MSRIPKKPNNLSHDQCISILNKIQEACFLELQIINESPMYVWSDQKPKHYPATVSKTVANALFEFGLAPEINPDEQ